MDQSVGKAGEAMPNAGPGGSKQAGWGGQGHQQMKTKVVVHHNPHHQQQADMRGGTSKQLKVEDALEYLEKVKKQFGKSPRIYNNFLEIMKNFKSQIIDTPGVIEAVSELFEGHPNLIYGFNTFLPPGYKIEVSQVIDGARGGGGKPAMGTAMAASNAAAKNADSSAPPPPAFDKAVHYVTRIKERFLEDENGTYKKFLDILHTYQQERRSIKDVLDKVADLFRYHPDLLREFTYFLPDAVQNEAKERLNSAAMRSQRRLKTAQKRMRSGSHAEQNKRRRTRKIAGEQFALPEPERRYFTKVKAVLDKDQWSEFVKCLDLFCHEVISRNELLDLIKDLFLGGKNEALFEQFTSVLTDHGVIENPMEEVWFSMPLSEIDFSQCRKCTPSYRALPSGYPVPPCSERGTLEHSVLNDNWVSVPTGSEDFAFKNMRKNAYEEQLFKCEDDRFEIDMVIESNMAAIRLLEPLAKEIAALREASTTGAVQYRLDRRSLAVTHLKAIARIYGDHGSEILELLRKTPAGAIPVILKRLKQKDVEWKKVRKELETGWTDVLQKNYIKSLEHRATYFRQHEKKQLSCKTLLHDIKTRFEQGKKRVKRAANALALKQSQAEDGDDAMDVVTPETGPGGWAANTPEKVQELLHAPHMSFEFSDLSLHRDAFAVISLALERSGMDEAALKACQSIWDDFLGGFFGLSGTVFDQKFAQSLFEDSQKETFAAGAKVQTPYGVAEVELYRLKGNTYKVKLPFGGHCFLGASAVSKPTAAETDAAAAAAAAAAEAEAGGAAKKSDPVEAVSITNSCEHATLGQNSGSLQEEAANTSSERNSRLFLGGNTAYLFFRLYRIFYHKLRKAKRLCGQRTVRPESFIESRSTLPDNSRYKGDAKPDCFGYGEYRSFLKLLCKFVMTQIDAATFEAECHEILGAESFVLASIDKLVQQVLKQLQAFACSETSAEFIDLYSKELERPQCLTKVYVAHAVKMQGVKGSNEGVFAFTMMRGIVAASDAKNAADGRPSVRQEEQLSGLPAGPPDPLGPQHGWWAPPTMQLRYCPDGETDYCLTEALRQYEGARDEESPGPNGDVTDRGATAMEEA